MVRQADFCIVAVGAVSTRRLLSAEGSHLTKATSHTGSTTGRGGRPAGAFGVGSEGVARTNVFCDG